MDNYTGEIKAFPYNFIPRGWLPCNGALLNITEYQALYAVITSTYNVGTVSPTQFCLPNLMGAVQVGTGPQFGTGQTGGAEQVALSYTQMPQHTHAMQVVTRTATSALTSIPTTTTYITDGNSTAVNPPSAEFIFSKQTATTQLHPATIGTNVGGVAHENRMPYLAMYFGICWDGVFPRRP